jgi:hypothetical protein
MSLNLHYSLILMLLIKDLLLICYFSPFRLLFTNHNELVSVNSDGVTKPTNE